MFENAKVMEEVSKSEATIDCYPRNANEIETKSIMEEVSKSNDETERKSTNYCDSPRPINSPLGYSK